MLWLAPAISDRISGVVCGVWHGPDQFHFFSMNVAIGAHSASAPANSMMDTVWPALLVLAIALVCAAGERAGRAWPFLVWALPPMVAMPLGMATFLLLRNGDDSNEHRVAIATTVGVLAFLLVGVYWLVLRLTARRAEHETA
jgi:hypothetical protein